MSDNQRFLKHRENGRIFPWSEDESKNPKFEVCTSGGVVTGDRVKPSDIVAVLAKKEKEINELKAEIERLNVYVVELEGSVQSKTSPSVYRKEELLSLTRKDLMAVASSKGIKNPAHNYQNGEESKLVDVILGMEYPELIKE